MSAGTAGRTAILHLIETVGPGGAETVLLDIVNALDPDEFRSHVVLTGPGWTQTALRSAGVPFTVVESSRANDLKLVLRLAEIVKREGIDLIHAHLPGMSFYGSLAGIVAGRPVVATYHGLGGGGEGEFTAKERVKQAIVGEKATTLVAVSDWLRRALICRWGMDSAKVRRIYNGVDFAALDAAARPGDLRAELGIPRGAPLVGMVGNIRTPKGYPYLIRAARRVADVVPDVRFVIVGTAEEEPELLDELKRLIRTLRLEETVILAGFRDDVPTVLQQLDVFALSSVSEGLSLATIEAMGSGRPIVATACGGPSEIIENGVDGLLVPPAHPEALAEGILLLLRDRELAARLSTHGRAAARARFGLDRFMSEYVETYRRALA